MPGKTNYQILRKVSEGRTDGQTDGQMDENDFIRRCPTNVERPIVEIVDNFLESVITSRSLKILIRKVKSNQINNIF